MTQLPLERAYFWEKHDPSSVFLTQPISGIARDWTWAQTMSEARRMASYLQSQNWPPGSRIIILSRNCAWWIMADLAVWMAGHTSAPLYTSMSLQSVEHAMQHADPVACFIGPTDNAELASIAGDASLTYIRFPNAPNVQAKDWEDIIRAEKPLAGFPQRKPDDVATIIYTSGTTGIPKGVMHGFMAFPYFAKGVFEAVGDTRERCLSYLPLAHIAERALVETSGLYFGWHLFFCEGIPTFLADLQRAKATVFFSVPRLYTKLQQQVLEKIPQSKLEGLLHFPVVSTLTKMKVLGRLGLGHVHLATSGSAALPPELQTWYRNLGLALVEGYGTTETGITHTPPGGRFKPGYVGQSVPGVETKLDENKQVLLKSPMNALGYFKDSEATKALFTSDGFVRTGDIGEIDSEGWLKIRGRLKEQFKTTKGKFVTPSSIEMKLSTNSAVDNCVVMGAGLDAPYAVIVLSPSARAMLRDPEGKRSVEQSLDTALTAINAQMEHYEQLRFLALVNCNWTLEQGFLTPTMKLKRHALEVHYQPLVSGWLAQNKSIVWHLDQ